MNTRRSIFALALLISSVAASAQTSRLQPSPAAASAPTAIPALVPYSGFASTASGSPLLGDTHVTFLIFKDEQGGEPLWTEGQVAMVDSTGHYKVQLGAANPNGLPSNLFATGEARWLEVQIAGQPEQPRVLLASVPYALKAADAATLGGLPASAFVLAGSKSAPNTAIGAAVTPDAATAVTTTGGTANTFPLFSGTNTIVNSNLHQSGASIGINTYVPAANLDVNGTAIIENGLQVGLLGQTLSGLSSSFYTPLVLEPTGTATTTKHYPSNYLKFETSGYNSSSKSVVQPRFQLQAEPTGNDTASPGGTLNLLASAGTTAPVETGFYINTDGTIHFASGQTFPGGGSGSGTITGVTAGTGLSGGGTSGTITLNVNTAVVPTVTGNNTYTGTNIFKPSLYTDTDMNVDNNNTNAGGVSPGIRFGSASGEGMASKRTSGGNQYGLDIYTDYAARMSVSAAGLVSIGTGGTFDGSQFQVQGAGGVGGEFVGGITSDGSGDSLGGSGLLATGGNGSTNNTSVGAEGGAGITATGGNASGSTPYTFGGDGGVFNGGSASNAGCCYEGGAGGDSPAMLPYTGSGLVAMGGAADSGTPGYGAVMIGGSTNTGTPQAGIYAISGTDENGNIAASATFYGDVNITGTLNADTKNFKIDHPADPANKYLVHTSIESSEMVNIYSGNVTTDEFGLATVKLPDWFEIENGDFRYQLTIVGRRAQAWISQEIKGGKFQIGSDATNTKVSWQVTGVRQDAYAKAHPLVVEQAKPVRERGFYMHPELYGQPKEKQSEWGRNPTMMRHIQVVQSARKTALKRLQTPVAKPLTANASH